MRKICLFLILLLSIFYFLFSVKIVNARFNADYLISDKDLTNANSMSQQEIDLFLKKQNGALASYQTKDIDGRIKPASEIIYRVSQNYQINPQTLITVLQKEQSLVTKKVKSNNQYDWATGFACYDGRKPIEKFRGFARQIDRAAWRLRYFLEHPWEFVFRPSQIYKISGRLVIPQNSATAALYNYTPHIRGNNIFWQIWQDWFGKSSGKIENGTLVSAKDDSGVWLIQNEKRRPFLSKNVFLASYSFKNIKIISKTELFKYEIGEIMDFPNYSLLQDDKKRIYLKVDKKIRQIAPDIFKKIGFNPEEIIKVDTNDLKNYEPGEPVLSPYPQGALLQDDLLGDIFWVKDNIKHPIYLKKILETNFPYDTIIGVKKQELDKFTLGTPVKFRDGVLLKNSNDNIIYLISSGKKHVINSQETFVEFGYRYEDIITVNKAILDLYETGESIEFVNGFSGN